MILVDEDTNQPSDSLIEVHKQLMFLQELSTGNEHRELVDFLTCQCSFAETWSIDANLVK